MSKLVKRECVWVRSRARYIADVRATGRGKMRKTTCKYFCAYKRIMAHLRTCRKRRILSATCISRVCMYGEVRGVTRRPKRKPYTLILSDETHYVYIYIYIYIWICITHTRRHIYTYIRIYTYMHIDCIDVF